MRRLLHLSTLCIALEGCGEKPADAPAKRLDPVEALARANELSHRHRVAEALQVIEASGAARAGTTPASEAVLALRKREAELLLNLARPREAVAILEDLSRAKPGEGSIQKSLAQAWSDLGEPKKAVAAFESLPAPILADSLSDYGGALLGASRLDDAAAVLAACLIRDPWSDAACLSLGRALVRLGRAEKGEIFLSRYRAGESFRRAEQEALAFEVEGDEARGFHRRARAERERGRLFEAMELENRAIQLNRGLGDAYLDLAKLSIFLARPADAVKVLEQLPQSSSMLDVLREAREAASAAQGARAVARDAMKGKPLSASVPDLLLLADDLERSGRRDDARRLALFLARLSRQSSAAAQTVVRLFNGAAEVFVRLWALEPQGSADAFELSLAQELEPLGIDPARVRRCLQ